MKKSLLLALFFFSFLGNAQTPLLQFQYDGAGNQIVRKICLTGCVSRNSDTTENEFQKFFPEDVISYYPNPVKEELFLKWELIEGKNVSSIEIYSLTGQLVKQYTNISATTMTIPFSSFREGNYMLLLQYSNGEQKSIQIIKN